MWHCLASVTPLQGPNVKVVVEIPLSQEDIERLRLRESREEYRSLFQQATDPMYLFDPETKRLLKANRAFIALLGYNAEEVETLSLYDLLTPDGSKGIDTHIQHILAYGDDIAAEQVWRRKDGTLIDVQVTMSLIQYGKSRMVFVMASEDK